MKAWEMERELLKRGKPRILTEDEQTWDMMEMLESQEDARLKILWHSNVPGSFAEERVIIGGVQAMENRGMDVCEAEKFISLGLSALQDDDIEELGRITCKLYHELYRAGKNKNSPYWNFKEYGSWDEFSKSARLLPKVSYDIFSKDYEKRIEGGWFAQVCAGALGTALEGYTTDNLREAFGDIRGYVRRPNTFNDDITYELAFLKAYEDKGNNITSSDIALEWAALIPFGWSAEDVALRNIKQGIYPPVSGFFNNPYYEWIGAQMRGAVCGMVAPGDPVEAARLAWIDGVISHYNNGVIGEVFNAILVSLSFVENEVRKIVKEAINMLPQDSEYYSVVKYALDKCMTESSWEDAWRQCEKRFERYNWVHAYPNIAAEIVALWFGNGDFDETMNIIAMEGQDVDCNAAQIGTVIGIIKGLDGIDRKWVEPIGDELVTYVRGMKKMKLGRLVQWTVESTRKAKEGV